MAKLAKQISDKDNVVTALADIVAGEEVEWKSMGRDMKCRCNQDIPFGHKVAIQDIDKGDKIVKYGESLGSATQDIKKGDWVHIHNVKDDYVVLDKDGRPLTREVKSA
jgi:altronate dehydratase small subunit